MAEKIAATPVLEGEDAKRFIKNLKTPSTPEEIRQLKEADEVFKKVNFEED